MSQICTFCGIDLSQLAPEANIYTHQTGACKPSPAAPISDNASHPLHPAECIDVEYGGDCTHKSAQSLCSASLEGQELEYLADECPLPWFTTGDSSKNPPMVWDAKGDSIVNQMEDGRPYFEQTVAMFIVQAANAAHRGDGKQRERDWRKMGTVEIAAENPNVSSYVEHWEDRTLKAESRVTDLEGQRNELAGKIVDKDKEIARLQKVESDQIRRAERAEQRHDYHPEYVEAVEKAIKLEGDLARCHEAHMQTGKDQLLLIQQLRAELADLKAAPQPAPLQPRCPKCGWKITLQRIANPEHCTHKAFVQCESCEFDVFVDSIEDLVKFFSPAPPRETEGQQMKFRKKPVVIEAMQWNGRDDESGIKAALDFIDVERLPHAPDDPHIHTGIGFTPSDGKLFIPTLEGTMCANPGDWIIRGIKGEYYPCKPDIFRQTYEPAEGQPGKVDVPNASDKCECGDIFASHIHSGVEGGHTFRRKHLSSPAQSRGPE